MKYLERTNVIYKMSGNNAPVCHIEDGDTLTVHTYDCFKDRLLNPESTVDSLVSDEVNPATGPVYIENAMPGDTLKVEILKISLAPVGVTEVSNDFGCLSHLMDGVHIKRLPVSDGKIVFNENLTLDAMPMIGVIGVAPENGAISTDTPDIHGGNMDCTQITEGSTIYFPVSVPGALLSLGDLHACMGDGEIGGCGAEIAGEVTMKVSVIHQYQNKYPVVLTKDSIIVIASKPTVEEAWKEAVTLLYEFIMEETRLPSHEVVMLLSLAGNLAICQTVNPNKTVRMSIPRKYLEACGFCASQIPRPKGGI